MKLKSTFIISLLIAATFIASAQTKPKPKITGQTEMQKQMEEAMKDMDPEEKAEFQKMMKGVMPDMTDKSAAMANYVDFATNKELVPKKDMARIAAIPKKKITQADISNYASNLYNKIMTKGEASEIALIKSILPKATTADDLNNAAVLCLEQGHAQAAMALSMKAVQKDPTDVNLQNNMASLLTQYGYPEQAIPVLDKLKSELPFNSTVLNNLGQAWFGLGELDSAKLNVNLAIRANPFHPEAQVSGGIIEEMKGDSKKAEQEYVKAMENGPNPVIQKILINKTGNKGLEKIDIKKFLESITIYEYFPENWIKIPKLSNSVFGFENDQSIHNGYATMFEDLDNKLQKLLKAATLETEILANKSEDEFIKTMKTENSKGINKMSRSAGTIIMVLEFYIAKWANQNFQDNIDLQNMIEAKREVMTKGGTNDNCTYIDRKNNAFLEYINPKIREYYAKKIEEFRVWLNAFCTWSWYMTGNPKNTILMNCLGWIPKLKELYEHAALDQEAISKCGVKMNGNRFQNIITPDIPDITCPTLVQVPIGKEWQQLSNTTKNFNANSLGINSNTGKAIPNHSVSFSAGKSSIAQSGIAPSVSTHEGSSSSNVTDAQVNSAISNRLLEQLKKINADRGNNMDLEPIGVDIRKAKILRDLLNKMMSADCKNLKSLKEKLRESTEKLEKGDQTLDLHDQDIIDKIKQNGIQSTINSAVQVPGNIQSQKGLFQ